MDSLDPSRSAWFLKWVVDALEVLDVSVRQVVISRRNAGLRCWASGLQEDLGARPNHWLHADFVPPSPFLVISDKEAKSSRISVEPRLIDAEFCKAWMPYFCGTGHAVVAVEQFLDFVGLFLPQEPVLDLHGITSQDPFEVARAEVYCGWAGWLASG